MSKYDWNNKAQIIEDLKNASSMSNFLNNAGITATSGNFHTFKKWMKIHNIEIKHFVKKVNSEDIILKYRNTIPHDEIFSIDSSYRKEAKDRIKKEVLIPYVCNGCGNKGEWNGKPLTLQLEHKNGDNMDNRLENLEYLCPNCHSQTPTFGSKNIHKKLFENRIKDLTELKVIDENSVLVLIEKWKISYGSVKYWIFKYLDKIESKNIKIDINKNFSHYKEDINTNILQAIINSDLSLKAVDEIARLYNLTSQSIRKLVKEMNPDIYENLEVSNTDKNTMKADLIQQQRIEYIKNIDKENFKLEEIQEYFGMQLEGLMPWILKHDEGVYIKIKSPLIKCCPECKSMNIKKKGIIKNKIPLQKYQCKECNKCFNYVFNN